MADLILNINFNESKRKNRLVIETYEGTIPNLKSKQYSGPLRNVNINGISSVDNLTSIELNMIKTFLNNEKNTQIKKYQYLISKSNSFELGQIANMGCLFSKEKENPMYQIESIIYDFQKNINYKKVNGLYYCCKRSVLNLYVENFNDEEVIKKIIPQVYVNLNESTYPLELVFNYDNYLINYTSRDRSVLERDRYRNYGFEKKIVDIIKSLGWKYQKTEGFNYIGKNISDDITKLINYDIIVFTNDRKKISIGDFSDIHVSYNIDWFEIKGQVQVDDAKYDISNLINLKKRRENWVEINNNIIFIPKLFNLKTIKTDKKSKVIILDKKYVSDAIGFANEINGRFVNNINKYLGYEDININLDCSIKDILKPYQLIGVKWMISLKKNGFGGCLADDMGLGKTLQIIAFLSDESMNNSCNLIVVPKTLLLNWEREIKKFLPRAKLYIYHGADRKSEEFFNYNIILSSYGTILNDIELIKNFTFENLIIDEAQYIKNSRSKIYNAIKKIKTDTRFLLTGTPIENNIKEFWGLMRLVNPEVLESYTMLSKKYTTDKIVEIVKRITAPFLLRRLKKDVLYNLPKKQEQVLYCRMEGDQLILYEKLLESIRYEILRKNDRFEIKSNSVMLNGLLYLQEVCCHPLLLNKDLNLTGCIESAKLDLLNELLISLYESNHKIVIFSRFTKMLKIIEKNIISLHMNYYYLDGKTKNRMEIVDQFENSAQGVFLISLKAGGTGINLISADTVIIYDPWWNPAIEKQAEDRVYRIGQKNNVMIYRLIVENSIEEKIQKLQQEKNDLYSEVLDGHKMPISITAEIMERLILD